MFGDIFDKSVPYLCSAIWSRANTRSSDGPLGDILYLTLTFSILIQIQRFQSLKFSFKRDFQLQLKDFVLNFKLDKNYGFQSSAKLKTTLNYLHLAGAMILDLHFH